MSVIAVYVNEEGRVVTEIPYEPNRDTWTPAAHVPLALVEFECSRCGYRYMAQRGTAICRRCGSLYSRDVEWTG